MIPSSEVINLIVAVLPLLFRTVRKMERRHKAARLDKAIAESDAAEITKILNERYK